MKTTKTEANDIKGYLDKALLDVSHISTYVDLLNEKLEKIKTYYYKDDERINIEENIKIVDAFLEAKENIEDPVYKNRVDQIVEYEND